MIQAFGWVALGLYLVAHLYISWKRSPNRRHYYRANFVAGVLFIINSAALMSWQSVAINVFWALISVLALRGIEVTLPTKARLASIGATIAAGLTGGILYFTAQSVGEEVLGWVGAALYVLAYFLLASEGISRRVFLWLNTLAALATIPVYTAHENWPALWMSITWVGVSLTGIVRLRLAHVGRSAARS